MDVISVTKEDGVSKQLSTSQEGPFKRFFLSHFRRVKRPISSPENARSDDCRHQQRLRPGSTSILAQFFLD